MVDRTKEVLFGLAVGSVGFMCVGLMVGNPVAMAFGVVAAVAVLIIDELES
jgi:hypothetical protein